MIITTTQVRVAAGGVCFSGRYADDERNLDSLAKKYMCEGVISHIIKKKQEWISKRQKAVSSCKKPQSRGSFQSQEPLIEEVAVSTGSKTLKQLGKSML